MCPRILPIYLYFLRCLLHYRGINRHWHADHVGGNLALAQAFPGLEIVGPLKERPKIPGLTTAVSGGDGFEWGAGRRVEVIDVGGHTLGHVAYHFPGDGAVFVGDSLFALGCGRLFEGTPEQVSLSYASRITSIFFLVCSRAILFLAFRAF